MREQMYFAIFLIAVASGWFAGTPAMGLLVFGVGLILGGFWEYLN